MGKPILGPIQRRFGPSCARRLYVMCKSTAFHDMQMECQRIKNYHSFFTVLLIYHRLLSITKFLTHRSLPNHSPINSWSPPIDPRYAEAVLPNFFLSSEAANLNLLSNTGLPAPVPYSVNEPLNIFITEDTSGWTISHNPPNVLLRLRSPEIPPWLPTTAKRQNGPNYHFHLVIISTYDPLDPHYEPPSTPKCFNQVNKLWRWKDTILSMIYLIKYSCGIFEKSESGSSSTSSSTSSIKIFLTVLPLYEEVILPVTHRIQHLCFLARQLHPDTQRIGRFCPTQTTQVYKSWTCIQWPWYKILYY